MQSQSLFATALHQITLPSHFGDAYSARQKEYAKARASNARKKTAEKTQEQLDKEQRGELRRQKSAANREAIRRAIFANPGCRLADIERNSGVPRGTLGHHIERLISDKLVERRGTNRYFPKKEASNG